MSLKGRETTTGGNIIIPMLIRTLATTKSMTRKGMNNRNPISKARLSSEIMKAGVTTLRGTSCAVAGRSILDNRIKSARSSRST